jgi:hypothetical protein
MALHIGPLHSLYPEAKRPKEIPLTASETSDTGRVLVFGEYRFEMKEVRPTLLQGTWAHEGPKVRFSCWLANPLTDFGYHADRGCINGLSKTGFNDWPIEQIRETRNGQCTQLEGVDLGEGNVSYPALNWNLQGAHLNGASLSFAHLTDAKLHGTQMTHLSYGYANITGEGDLKTQLPEQGCEKTVHPVVQCSL